MVRVARASNGDHRKFMLRNHSSGQVTNNNLTSIGFPEITATINVLNIQVRLPTFRLYTQDNLNPPTVTKNVRGV
jgi:hypothetical protein